MSTDTNQVEIQNKVVTSIKGDLRVCPRSLSDFRIPVGYNSILLSFLFSYFYFQLRQKMHKVMMFLQQDDQNNHKEEKGIQKLPIAVLFVKKQWDC